MKTVMCEKEEWLAGNKKPAEAGLVWVWMSNLLIYLTNDCRVGIALYCKILPV